MNCQICAYAEKHGSWPASLKSGTHCGFTEGCHRSWHGKKEAHCAECHAHFSTDKLADKHRRNGVCLNPAETVSKSGANVYRLCTTAQGEKIWRSADAMPLKPEYAR